MSIGLHAKHEITELLDVQAASCKEHAAVCDQHAAAAMATLKSVQHELHTSQNAAANVQQELQCALGGLHEAVAAVRVRVSGACHALLVDTMLWSCMFCTDAYIEWVTHPLGTFALEH
jgi:cell division protein ZapA (FtsZ GTPase activity inhibitor)